MRSIAKRPRRSRKYRSGKKQTGQQNGKESDFNANDFFRYLTHVCSSSHIIRNDILWVSLRSHNTNLVERLLRETTPIIDRCSLYLSGDTSFVLNSEQNILDHLVNQLTPLARDSSANSSNLHNYFPFTKLPEGFRELLALSSYFSRCLSATEVDSFEVSLLWLLFPDLDFIC